MPTEIEHYTDEELMRDVERNLEAERAHEDFENNGKETEDDLEFPKETDDEVLQDVLEYKGGHPEDWELTHQSGGEYMFNGSEMISIATGESLTKQIEGGFDEAYISAHHDTLEQLKSGESMIRLPDFEEEKDNGDIVLHVTHLLRGEDDSISYEIRSTVIARREEEEIFDTEEVAEETETFNEVEFYGETEDTAKEHVDTVAETTGHAHETTFETPVTQEVAPTAFMEQRTESTFEGPAREVSAEIGEETREASWLSRFLNSESPAPEPERHEIFESLPVFVAAIEEKTVEEPVEQARLAQQENEEVDESIFVEKKIEVVTDTEIERPIEQAVTPNEPESFVAPQVEHAPVSTQQTVEIQREILEAITEQKQSVVEKKEKPTEIRPITLRTEHAEPVAKVESVVRPVATKEAEVRRSEAQAPKDTRREMQPEKLTVDVAQIRPMVREVIHDAPTSFENSKNERVVLSSNEILLRSLGIPVAPRSINTREVVSPEALRTSRYSPPQNDNTPAQTTTRRSLNGISMRRAA